MSYQDEFEATTAQCEKAEQEVVELKKLVLKYKDEVTKLKIKLFRQFSKELASRVSVILLLCLVIYVLGSVMAAESEEDKQIEATCMEYASENGCTRPYTVKGYDTNNILKCSCRGERGRAVTYDLYGGDL